MKRLIYYLLTFLLFMFVQPLAAQDNGILKFAGLSGKSITSVAVESSEEMTRDYWNLNIAAGTEDDGIYFTSIDTLPIWKNTIPDGETSFTPVWEHLGLNGKKITALTIQHWGVGPMDGQMVFAAVSPEVDSILIYKRNVYYSQDPEWIPADSGLNRSSPPEINALSSYYYTGHTPPEPVLMGSNSGLFYYENEIWSAAEFEGPVQINGLDVAPHWFGNLAWASGQQGLSGVALRSTDKGKTWTKIFMPSMIENFVFSIAINPVYPDTVYVGSIGGMWVTTNNGETWDGMAITDVGIPINITSIAIDPVWPDIIYAAGSHVSNSFFFYYSMDAGVSWQNVSPPDSINIAAVSSIAVVHTADVEGEKSIAVIGTQGTGVWLFEAPQVIDDVNPETIVKDFILYQNYPNPFNPKTSMQYAINSRQFVNLKIYDILGMEVATLVNEEKESGSYEVTFDASGLTSGIYFYKLSAGEYSETKRMVLLK